MAKDGAKYSSSFEGNALLALILGVAAKVLENAMASGNARVFRGSFQLSQLFSPGGEEAGHRTESGVGARATEGLQIESNRPDRLKWDWYKGW
jgi:hypothetical protein